uniref:Bm13216 n=1 Tax=Brugia malayi TaxID=6279 RepID=A0A1I9G6A6_BRUMA|nr:Bm13216 [Brugia malayi]
MTFSYVTADILILMNQMKCFTMFFINPFLVFRLKKSYSKRRYLKAIWALQLIKVNI